VSLLWASHLKVFLGSRYLEVRYTSGLTKKVMFSESVEFSQEQDDSSKIALQQLKKILQKIVIKKNTDFTVYLAADMARYLCLPAQNLTMNKEEINAFIHAMFQKVYAQDERWIVQSDHGFANQSIVAYAIEKNLLAQLQALAENFQLNMQIIEPYFAYMFNRLIKKTQLTDFVFFLLEPNRVMSINVQQQDIQKIKVQKLDHSGQAKLSPMQLMHRELALSEHQQNILILNKTSHPLALEQLSNYQLIEPHLAAPKSRQFLWTHAS
jgi:DNA-binding TFAR19-related protein (PDSD5 family)